MPSFTIPFKKYTAALPPHEESSTYDPLAQPLKIETQPNWLNIYYAPTGVGNNITIFFQVKESAANVLPPGTHTATVRIRRYFGSGATFSLLSTYEVTINVEDTVLLTLTPSVMNFNYVIGDAAPDSQNLNIQSENNWSITAPDSWVTLSTTFGSINGDVAVGIDPTGLVVGNYQSIVVVDDGVFQKILTVNLQVTGATTPTNYLTVNPIAVEFNETLSIPSTQTKNLSIDASEAWTAVKDATWLSIDIASGGIGVSTMVLSVVSDPLAVGTYSATIEITTTSVIKTVNVVLRITAVATTGITSGNLYFADDRNTLSISTNALNTFSLLEFVATAANETLMYPKKAPFFKGLATTLIGTETENLLQTNGITTDFSNRIYTPVKPVSYDFNVYDKVLFSSENTLRQSLTAVKFLNGKTPQTANRLTYLPPKITTTKDAVIALSFIADPAPTAIEITGDITQSIIAIALENTVYTAIIDLATLALSVGDNITITVGGQAVEVTIKHNEAEHTLFTFENEWNCPEFFNLTGKLKITSNKGWTTTKVDNNGDVHEKIIEASHPIAFSINTGFIYSQDEIDWLTKVFECKKMYIYIKGQQIEVIPTFSRLITYETREHTSSFNLTFKKAIV